jgi:hypothetical protein
MTLPQRRTPRWIDVAISAAAGCVYAVSLSVPAFLLGVLGFTVLVILLRKGCCPGSGFALLKDPLI